MSNVFYQHDHICGNFLEQLIDFQYFAQEIIKCIKDSKKLPQPNMMGNQEVDIFLALYWNIMLNFHYLNYSNLK